MARRQQKSASDLGTQAIELAEQLGRIAGTVEGTAEAWLNRPSLTRQLQRVRDGATRILESLSEASGVGRGRKAGQARKKKKMGGAAGAHLRRTDPAHAPGKRRRGPAPTARGVKKSDGSIPKLRTARAVRQRRKNNA
jgi:hypothetical protein